MTVRARLTMLANLAFWVVVVYACATYVVPQWRQFDLSHRLQFVSVPWLCLATAVFAVQCLVVFFAWWFILRALVGVPSWRPFYRSYVLSLLPRYVPGKLLAQGVRTRLAVLEGVSTHAVIASLVWEMVLGFVSTACIAGLGLLFGRAAGLEHPTRWILAVLAVVAFSGIVIPFLPKVGPPWRAWLGFAAMIRSPATIPGILSLYLVGWVLATLAHWILAHAIASLPVEQLFSLMVALSTSWAVGVLTFFAPAGLGVREGVLFLFARGWMGPSNALLFVALSRLCALLAEALLTLTAAVMPSPLSPSLEAIPAERDRSSPARP